MSNTETVHILNNNNNKRKRKRQTKEYSILDKKENKMNNKKFYSFLKALREFLKIFNQKNGNKKKTKKNNEKLFLPIQQTTSNDKTQFDDLLSLHVPNSNYSQIPQTLIKNNSKAKKTIKKIKNENGDNSKLNKFIDNLIFLFFKKLHKTKKKNKVDYVNMQDDDNKQNKTENIINNNISININIHNNTNNNIDNNTDNKNNIEIKNDSILEIEKNIKKEEKINQTLINKGEEKEEEKINEIEEIKEQKEEEIKIPKRRKRNSQVNINNLPVNKKKQTVEKFINNDAKVTQAYVKKIICKHFAKGYIKELTDSVPVQEKLCNFKFGSQDDSYNPETYKVSDFCLDSHHHYLKNIKSNKGIDNSYLDVNFSHYLQYFHTNVVKREN